MSFTIPLSGKMDSKYEFTELSDVPEIRTTFMVVILKSTQF
jgi:hypothetical protein